MGDILSLIEKAEQNSTRKRPRSSPASALTGDGFSLEDFRDQLRQVKKMGSIQSLMGMLPSVGPFSGCRRLPIKWTKSKSTASKPSSTP